MKEKVAFVASGGGMLCAWSAGVAWGLQESGVRPDMFIGSSGSAGTVSYFACGEAQRAAQLWREEVTNPRVMSKKPLRLDVDFVIDSMRDRFAFDEQKLRAPHVDLYLAATDYRSIRTRFFSNHEHFNWYEVMRASMAIPFIYGHKIMLDGKRYFDGDVSTSLESSIALAKEKGATTIYVCDTRSADSFWQYARLVGLRPLLTMAFIKSLIGIIRKRTAKKLAGSDGVNIIYFKLAENSAAASFDNSKAAVQKAIESGYAEAKRRITATEPAR